ncbi:hypothetical protein CXF95_05935 [Paraglaciecola sp. MB-3u-78]|nr:hypothetical protein CXF95_05935 [Paraglaciecola sp. MB-3u-78]
MLFSKITFTLLLLTPLLLISNSSHAKLIIRGSLAKSAGGGDLEFLYLVPGSSPQSSVEPQKLRFIDYMDEYITAFPVHDLGNAASLVPLLSEIEFQIPGETGTPDFGQNDLCSPVYCFYEFALDEALMLQGLIYPIDESEHVISNYVWSILDANDNVLFNLSATRDDNNIFNVPLNTSQRDLLGVGSYKVSVTATHSAANDSHFKVFGLDGQPLTYLTDTEKYQLNTDGNVFIETSSIYNLKVTEAQQTVDVPEPRLLFLWSGLLIALMYMGKKRQAGRF